MEAIEIALLYLSPHQLSVGVKGGCKAIIHAASDIFSSSSPSASTWILQLDFHNAFNSIDRETLFHEVRRQCPKLSAWVELC